MTDNKCSLKVVTPNGKRLHGTAAILHMTSINGGFDAWLQNFAVDVAKTAVNNLIEEQQKPKKQNLRLLK